jgi:hypothetical protein
MYKSKEPSRQVRSVSMKRPSSNRSRNYSILTGGGSGTGLTVLVDNLVVDHNAKLAVQTVVPWCAAGLAIVAPSVFRFCHSELSYRHALFFLWRARRLQKALSDDPEMRAIASQNIKEIETMVMEMNTRKVRRITDHDDWS